MKKVLKILAVILVVLLLIFFLYCSNTAAVDRRTVSFYKDLKDSLTARGFAAKLLVVSTKRAKWHNALLVKLSGAEKESKHLTGQAMDFIVFDINKDGRSDSADVNIVYEILDKSIVGQQGGLGTYKGSGSKFYQQMIHIDCRGHRARWSQ